MKYAVYRRGYLIRLFARQSIQTLRCRGIEFVPPRRQVSMGKGRDWRNTEKLIMFSLDESQRKTAHGIVYKI